MWVVYGEGVNYFQYFRFNGINIPHYHSKTVDWNELKKQVTTASNTDMVFESSSTSLESSLHPVL